MGGTSQAASAGFINKRTPDGERDGGRSDYWLLLTFKDVD